MTPTPDPALLAPLFRATFTTADAAEAALLRPEVAVWFSGTVLMLWRTSRLLQQAYADEITFVDHCMGVFFEKLLKGQGFGAQDGAAMTNGAGWLATVVKNIVRDVVRREKRQHGREVSPHYGGDDDDQPAWDPADPNAGPSAEALVSGRGELGKVLSGAREILCKEPRWLGIFLAFAAPAALSCDDIEAASREGGALFVRPPDKTWALLREVGRAHGAPILDEGAQAEIAWVLCCRDFSVGGWEAWRGVDPRAASTARDTTQKAFRRARDRVLAGLGRRSGE